MQVRALNSTGLPWTWCFQGPIKSTATSIQGATPSSRSGNKPNPLPDNLCFWQCHIDIYRLFVVIVDDINIFGVFPLSVCFPGVPWFGETRRLFCRAFGAYQPTEGLADVTMSREPQGEMFSTAVLNQRQLDQLVPLLINFDVKSNIFL